MTNSEYFNDRVEGRVRAELITDKEARPEFLTSESALKHYKIRLFLETRNRNIQTVIYKLHPTYFSPVRESHDSQNNFAIELTTYGNYPITVEAMVGSEIVRTVVDLADLLRATHGKPAEQNLARALKDIESN